jgi:hypothetical protein
VVLRVNGRAGQLQLDTRVTLLEARSVKHEPNTFCRASAEVAQKWSADGQI